MAERVEEPETETEEALDQASPAAVALALGQTSRSKDIDEDARTFLREQTGLLRLQKEHLHEQRVLQLSHMRWRRFSDRMRALLQMMTAVVGLLIAGGVGWMAWSASQERGLVIEPFSVPPDLAQRGLTGQVVASLLLDRLGEMQNGTKSSRAPSTYANNWNDEIKVEIPETGVSVGELRRLLVQWLGHQTTISGELYRTPSGIALSARTGAAPAKSHTGAEGDLDALVQQAAEDVYATTQPYRYAVYLGRQLDADSTERSRQALQQLASSGDRIDRVWALGGLSNALMNQGDQLGAIRTASAAIALEPRFSLPYDDRSNAEGNLGHDEASMIDERTAAQMVGRYGSQFLASAYLTRDRGESESGLAGDLGDYGLAARLIASALTRVSGDNDLQAQLIVAQAMDHDVDAATESESGLSLPPPADTSVNAALARAKVAEGDAIIALELDDWSKMKRAISRFDVPQLGELFAAVRRTQLLPYTALADAKLGDFAGAQQQIAATPPDCNLCVRMRGQIAAAMHDWPTADRWFAEAVRQAPSLPFAYAEWGKSLLARGDPDAAIAKLQIAHAKSAHFADAMELWGEALAAKGDVAGAALKFAQADQDAPHWGRNHLRWGQALLGAGRYAQARAQFEAADDLGLSAPDRAALDVFLARTATGPLHG